MNFMPTYWQTRSFCSLMSVPEAGGRVPQTRLAVPGRWLSGQNALAAETIHPPHQYSSGDTGSVDAHSQDWMHTGSNNFIQD